MNEEQNFKEPQNQQLNIAGVSGSALPEGWMFALSKRFCWRLQDNLCNGRMVAIAYNGKL